MPQAYGCARIDDRFYMEESLDSEQASASDHSCIPLLAVAASAGSDSESALVGVVAAPMLIDRFLRQSRVWRWLWCLRHRSSVIWSIFASTNAVSSLMDALHYSNFVEPVRVATYLSSAPHCGTVRSQGRCRRSIVVCGATQLVCGAKWLFAASIEDGRRAVAAAELLSAACSKYARLCAAWSTDVGAGVGAGGRGAVGPRAGA